ncbi:MAG: DUF2059 domain-containing protein [Caulobacteraceae bacterium]|nr:DUF2059 domain-containing protein [Caulobacteraceae bacterium]
MNLAHAFLIATAGLALCAGARAEPPPLGVAADAGAQSGAADPQRLALAERYMADTHADRQLRATLDVELRRGFEAGMRRVNAGMPEIPQQVQAEGYQALLGAARSIEPRVHDRVARLLASEYTTQELQALVDFYETPVGRQIAEKSLDIPTAARRATEDIGPQFLAEFKRRLCAHNPECRPGAAQ